MFKPTASREPSSAEAELERCTSEENIDCSLQFCCDIQNISYNSPCGVESHIDICRKSFSLCGDLSAVSVALESHAFLNSKSS